MSVIVDAYEHHLELLRWMFDKPTPPMQTVAAQPSAGTPMNPKLFMAMFGKN